MESTNSQHSFFSDNILVLPDICIEFIVITSENIVI